MPDAMPDSLTEYEMDREERLAKNRAVLAALSIPSLAAETRETPDEIGDGSRRRGRAAASTSTAPSRRSSRAEARKVKTYADAPGEDWGDRASGESDAGSDSGRARAEEAADADFRGSESESEGSEEDDEDDARVARARGDTPEIVELDEDGEEVGGEAKGKGRARGEKRRERNRKGKRKRGDGDGAGAGARDDENDADADARDAFLAFLAPSASVAVRRGFLKLEDATFGLRELRAVVDAHGFEDWTNEELAHMLAPEAVGRPQRESDVDAGAAAAGTDPSAADARRRAAAAAAAAETRLGVSDLARLAETVGARRRAT
jgi:hypothetical protein